MGDEIRFDPPWMRQRASDCDGAKRNIQGLLQPSDGAADKLRRAADGWSFLDSIDDMMHRWQDLNKLLRGELDDSAEKIRNAAEHHGKNEGTLEHIFHELNPFD